MIYELKQDQFNNAVHLLNGDFINLEIKSVIKGYNPGWVFVDNPEEPKTAMVWSKGIRGFYFVGDENNINFNNSIDNYIDKEIFHRAKTLGMDYFEFSGTSLEWEATLESVFAHRDILKSKQFVYKNNIIEDRIFENVKLNNDYSIKKIDLELLNSGLLNLDFIKSIILEWWDTTEDLLAKGVGYCILHNQRAVSVCTASFVTEESMESHIVTLEDFRKKGLAKKAVSEFLKHCKANSYEAYWDCMEKNIGSRALAESLGYKKAYEYSLYEFKLG